MVPFNARGQFSEDLKLWERLSHVENGRYIDVGANHPTDSTVTYAFYEQGWQGITVEPIPLYSEAHVRERPRDFHVCGTVGHDTLINVVPGSGLSSTKYEGYNWPDQYKMPVEAYRMDDVIRQAGWGPGEPIHFVSIDVEGAERDVLETFDLELWKPWFLVIEAVVPNGREPTNHLWEDLLPGYREWHNDGVNRFYELR